MLPLDIPADTEYAGVRAKLEAAGQPIGMNDLLIAAQVQALSLTLVTGNMREFSCIRGLKVENWLESWPGRAVRAEDYGHVTLRSSLHTRRPVP